MTTKIGFIGCGKLAQAMIRGLISSGVTKPNQITASSPPQDNHLLNDIKQLGCNVTNENQNVARESNVIMVAVKPSVVIHVLREINTLVTPNHLIMSTAMGITIKSMEKNLPPKSRVIRIMTNTPALVQKAATVYSRGTAATDEDAQMAKTLLESFGTCDEVPEGHINAVTALSSSGPAYIFLVIEAMVAGGLKMGLPKDVALKLASQTVIGAGQMVKETGQHPAVLRDEVTSPGGCTAAGLFELEDGGVRAAFINAIEAATERCEEQSNS